MKTEEKVVLCKICSNAFSYPITSWRKKNKLEGNFHFCFRCRNALLSIFIDDRGDIASQLNIPRATYTIIGEWCLVCGRRLGKKEEPYLGESVCDTCIDAHIIPNKKKILQWKKLRLL